MRRIRPSTVLLLALIAVLGASLVARQRREARLREALALYRMRAEPRLENVMRSQLQLSWPDGTSLGEAIRRIEAGIQASYADPRGLSVILDPDGLRESGQTLDSPVKSPPKDEATGEPLSLAWQLQVVLKPLGLVAEIRDGAIVITSRGRGGAAGRRRG